MLGFSPQPLAVIRARFLKLDLTLFVCVSQCDTQFRFLCSVTPRYLVCSFTVSVWPLTEMPSILFVFSAGRLFVCPLFRYSSSVFSLFNVRLFSSIHSLNSFSILLASLLSFSFVLPFGIRMKSSAKAYPDVFYPVFLECCFCY